MTAKTPERIRREAARECAEQLAVIVTECTWDAAGNWLSIQMREAEYGLSDLALILASMVPSDDAYKPVVAERFGIGKRP